MTLTLKDNARLIASRVDSESVLLDPITIFTIITQVLPLVVACWNKNDEPNAELSSVNFKRYHSAHPEQVRRRLARRIRGEADAPMTKSQSLEFADAIIAQVLESSVATVAACCREAQLES